MCGIAGFFTPTGARPRDGLEERVTAMALAIEHRGPDDAGAWADSGSGIALGHRRLSIIDLSPAGHQPMVSAGGRYVVVFNGEIYNHALLRAELEKARDDWHWRGHSDTETLLAAFEQWGIESTLRRTVGMFALAVWDRTEKSLSLARDRFGEKPLYYGWVGGDFVFGSELKALRAYSQQPFTVSREALAQYLRFMYVPAPRSIYEGIYKLEPGCILNLQGTPPASPPAQPLRPPARHEGITLTRWWSLGSVVEKAAAMPLTDSSEALEQLEATLKEAVKLQSLADVPLGAFLSGGVDSSTVVALMQELSSRPVKTFTIGYEEAEFDESPHAKAVAAHLGTAHEELFVTAAEARAVIPRLPSMYDEPFADSSQIPTHLVCRAARQHVTVALSGDAGDELFGGYNRYFWGPRIWHRLAWMPFWARKMVGGGIATIPVGGWDALGGALNNVLPQHLGVARAGDKAHKLAARLSTVQSMDDLYMSLVCEWQDPIRMVVDGPASEPTGTLQDPLPAAAASSHQLSMMYRDTMTYLPDDILCKVDRAAMAVSLETRVPFLDHRVAELAWRMPLDMKIRDGQGKWALRQVLYRRVPKELIERPKAGFGIPVGQWIRGPLRPWAESLLDPRRLAQEGFFHPEVIQKAWTQHLNGHQDHTHRLWSIPMVQAWLEENH
jgi:asparagine synthase (glutamine-hydrolysing)